ncbi:MAG: hypothetical protein JEY79_11235 [Pseudodesulfovibrio sp.]|nr:hypothetical protein [Pseudodesulfovibrio sp.]
MYELNGRQKYWLHHQPDKDELRRFLIHGPVDFVVAVEDGYIKIVGTLRGVRVTKPLDNMALALKEAELIREEFIQKVGMIPLDEEGLGIDDTQKQRTTA